MFDYLTFGVLMLFLHADMARFRTGWFIESVLSASLIVLVIRNTAAILQSPPRIYLSLATLFVMAFTVALPWTPLGRLFGFVPLPLEFTSSARADTRPVRGERRIVKRVFYRHTS